VHFSARLWRLIRLVPLLSFRPRLHLARYPYARVNSLSLSFSLFSASIDLKIRSSRAFIALGIARERKETKRIPSSLAARSLDDRERVLSLLHPIREPSIPIRSDRRALAVC